MIPHRIQPADNYIKASESIDKPCPYCMETYCIKEGTVGYIHCDTCDGIFLAEGQYWKRNDYDDKGNRIIMSMGDGVSRIDIHINCYEGVNKMVCAEAWNSAKLKLTQHYRSRIDE